MRAKAFWIVAAAALLASAPSKADVSDGRVRVGVLTDMSGIFSGFSGSGSLLAATMAVEDAGGSIGGRPVDVISADHQNKADVAAQIARRWIDEQNVDVLVDMVNSSVALAVSEIARTKGKASLVTSAGTSFLTGKNCAPTTVHWTFDTVSLANSAALATMKAGGKRWFTIGADSAYGLDMEDRIRRVVTGAGASFVGAIRHPYGAGDFTSFLTRAQGAKADVVVFNSAGQDTTNAVKQAQEFQLDRSGIRLLTPGITITDVKGLGLQSAQGLLVSEPFYWDANEGTRAWSERFFKRHGAMPTSYQAGVYASVGHYLKAVKALGSDAGPDVVAKMKELPTDDPLFGKGVIRADGRKIHDFHLFEVKKPSESKSPWDLYKLVDTVSGDQAFLPLAQSDCPLVKR